jgi:hypothetical protein
MDEVGLGYVSYLNIQDCVGAFLGTKILIDVFNVHIQLIEIFQFKWAFQIFEALEEIPPLLIFNIVSESPSGTVLDGFAPNSYGQFHYSNFLFTYRS